MAKQTYKPTQSAGAKTPDTGGGKTPFIDKNTAFDAYDESRKWMRVYFDPLDELERIARNKPSPNIDPSLPRVTDGTMAAIVQEAPKRIIQQLSTGKVSCNDYPEYAAVADIVLSERLLPLYNRMGSALQKDWNMLGKALTYGRSTSYTFFTSSNGQFHTDFVIPYVKDVLDEKGKVFGGDNNIRFLRSWYQKRDLQAILNRERALVAATKSYKSDWDLPELAAFMDAGASAKPSDQMTPAEKEKGGDNGGYEMIHAFQVGKGSEFYSFAPRHNNGKPMRVKTNSDPRGRLPLDDLYCNIDLSNPLGRGSVELSGGVQNLIDQQMQMFQFIMTLLMGPPLQTWGNVDKKTLKFLPNAVWDMGGTSSNNKVEPYKVDNTAISTFPNNYGLLKSQIMNLNSSQDHSMSAPATGGAQSKTQAGVQAQEQRLGVSDNYLRKQFEDWDSDQRETSLNIFFSEMKGSESIELGPQQLRELSTTRAAQFINEKTGKLNIKYSQMTDVTFKFESDPGSSKAADDADQMQRLQEAITEVTSNGPVLNWYLGQQGKKLNVGEIYLQLFKRMGLENLDSIINDMSPEEKQAAAAQPFPIIDKPQIRLNSADLSPAALVAALQSGGVQIADPKAAGAPSAQAQLDFQVEMAKAQAAGQSAGAPSGPNPDELAIKHRELDLKQQAMDQSGVKTALEVAKTAHSHTMDTHNAAVAASAPPEVPNDGSSPQDEQAEPPQTMAAEQQPAPAPPDTGGQAPALTDALSPEELQVAHALLSRGFSEADIEQAIVMLRQRVPIDQIIKVLGAKNNAPANR